MTQGRPGLGAGPHTGDSAVRKGVTTRVTPLPGTKMWDFQKDYVVRHYDNGWSHEKATMATERWSAEDIERMRLELLVRANGADPVTELVRRGTWPVDA